MKGEAWMLKRFLAIMIIAILVLLCSCKSGNVTSTPDSSNDDTTVDTNPIKITLLYNATDSLNPYEASTLLNRQLSLLIFDSLVRLTPTNQPEYVLAESIDLVGKQCTVTLKKVMFSDGSAVTANDVVYSFNLAKKSSTVYATQLATAKSISANEDGSLSILLSKADPYFTNLLDFPVIKAESDKLTDENKRELPPIGSGRYIPQTESSQLTANLNHILGAALCTTIELINSPDNAVASYNLQSGNVSIYSTELEDGKIPSMTGNSYNTNLNNLVYLGVNLNDSVLKSEKMRYAISDAINRSDICQKAYHSFATAATGIFNPLWNDAKGLQNLSSSNNLQNVITYLEELGYNTKDNEGYYLNSKGKRLSFDLVCNSDNERRMAAAELIKQQLSSAGIEINIRSLKWEAYKLALSSGDFDLYIAETRLLNNMDITELVKPGASLAFGIVKPVTEDSEQSGDGSAVSDQNKKEVTESTDSSDQTQASLQTTWNAVNGFYNEKFSLVDIINNFNAEMPLIPICYRSGLTVTSSAFNAEGISSVTDAYYGISTLKNN